MDEVIIQGHLNEDASRSMSPRVPLSVEEVAADAIACADAGMSIAHYHARTPDGGQDPHNVEYFREVARRARKERSDLLWYPPQPYGATPQFRWRHVPPLVEDPEARLELITIDPGSGDLMYYDPESKDMRVPEMISQLVGLEGDEGTPVAPLAQWVWFCEEARRLNIRPIFGVLEPGFIQRILAWHDRGIVDEPLAFHFFFTERYCFGPPAEPESIDFYLRMLPDGVRTVWFVSPSACTQATESRLVRHALERGGHIRVGAGSPPVGGWGSDAPSNPQLVEDAVALVEKMGRTVASPDRTRELLGVTR